MRLSGGRSAISTQGTTTGAVRLIGLAWAPPIVLGLGLTLKALGYPDEEEGREHAFVHSCLGAPRLPPTATAKAKNARHGYCTFGRPRWRLASHKDARPTLSSSCSSPRRSSASLWPTAASKALRLTQCTTSYRRDGSRNAPNFFPWAQRAVEASRR